MQRDEIINHLIHWNGYKSYLEIGVWNGSNYERIQCDDKECCEPFPVGGTEKLITYKMTSDEMFATVPDDKKWDIIFIDGLHTEEQVGKDIINSLKHLKKGGKVVVHDCLPSKEEETGGVYKGGVWCGDVYKAITQLSKQGISYYTVNSNYGVGVIDYYPNPEWLVFPEPSDITFKEYYGNWVYLTNAVSPEEFLETKGDCFKQHVILLIGLSRYKNLQTVVDSIEYVAKLRRNITFHAVVCGSVNLTEYERNESIKTLFASQLSFLWFDTGEKGVLKFGGDIYNGPLVEYHDETLRTVDPWVYVLDDDNLLNNRMFEKVEYVSSAFPKCRSIRFNGADDNGNIEFNDDGHRVIDPSYVIVRYSLLEENGFYGSGPGYDHDSFKPMIDADRTVMLENATNYAATHNAIVDPEWFDKMEEFLKTQDCTGMFRIQSNSADNEFPHLTRAWRGQSLAFQIGDNDTIRKVLDVIKEYYRKKNLL